MARWARARNAAPILSVNIASDDAHDSERINVEVVSRYNNEPITSSEVGTWSVNLWACVTTPNLTN